MELFQIAKKDTFLVFFSASIIAEAILNRVSEDIDLRGPFKRVSILSRFRPSHLSRCLRKCAESNLENAFRRSNLNDLKI